MTLTAPPRAARRVDGLLVPVRSLAGFRPEAPGRPAMAVRRVPLQVTTIRQAAGVAMDRTRRFTLLGQVPVVGPAVVPWLWPLHMFIVGLTAGNIRLTRHASLSFCDGRTPRRHGATVIIAVASGMLWLTVLTAVALTLTRSGLPTIAVAVVVVAALPALVELAGLLEFAVLNPEWVTIKRERARRCGDRPTYVLTSLVATTDGHDFAGDLMDLTYRQWQAADAVVIGYPASKALISYYVRMGAVRERQQTASAKPAHRRITFDCRQPLRCRVHQPLRSASPRT